MGVVYFFGGVGEEGRGMSEYFLISKDFPLCKYFLPPCTVGGGGGVVGESLPYNKQFVRPTVRTANSPCPYQMEEERKEGEGEMGWGTKAMHSCQATHTHTSVYIHTIFSASLCVACSWLNTSSQVSS